MKNLKIMTTEDGSQSLFDEQLRETYHSTKGARGESMHVFIKEGLAYWHAQNPSAESIRVLEIGMGTGLNVFLSALWSEQHAIKVHMTTLEPYPIESGIYENLNYHKDEREASLFAAIHNSPWQTSIDISPSFSLTKNKATLESYNTADAGFDVLYFDAFAPGKQPEVWFIDNLKKCHALLRMDGALTTYCAQGQFKRNLKEVGFEVQTLQGAMGKKEMTRAIRQ